MHEMTLDVGLRNAKTQVSVAHGVVKRVLNMVQHMPPAPRSRGANTCQSLPFHCVTSGYRKNERYPATMRCKVEHDLLFRFMRVLGLHMEYLALLSPRAASLADLFLSFTAHEESLLMHTTGI